MVVVVITVIATTHCCDLKFVLDQNHADSGQNHSNADLSGSLMLVLPFGPCLWVDSRQVVFSTYAI